MKTTSDSHIHPTTAQTADKTKSSFVQRHLGHLGLTMPGVLASFLFATGAASADTLTWDNDGAAGIQDGDGNWDSVNSPADGVETNWTIDGGATNQGFTNFDRAIFGSGGTGTVTLTSDIRTGGSGYTFNDAYTIDTNGFELGGQGGSNITANSGAGSVSITGSGEYRIFTDTSVATQSGGDSVVISAQVTGASALSRIGGGDGGYLVLSNNTNSFTGGLAVNNGGGGIAVTSVADIGDASAAGAGGYISIASNGAFQFRGASGETDRELRLLAGGWSIIDNVGGGALVFDGNVVNSKTAGHVLDLIGNTGSSTEIQGVLADNGASPLQVQARLQTNAILSGVNTFTGDITANNSAQVTIGGAGQLGAGNYAGTIDLNQSAKFVYASSADQIISGNIIDDGGNAVEHSGTGTLSLTGTNNWSGLSRITGGGTLLINGDSSAATNEFYLNTGTLGGTGQHGGKANVRFGGKMSAGDGGIGSISFEDLVYSNTVNQDGSFLFDLSNPGSSDLITVDNFNILAPDNAKDFDLDAFVFTDLSAPGSRIGVGDYTLIDYTTFTGLTTFGSDVFTDSLFGYASATLIDNGSAIVLSVTAVPEPSSTALLGLGGLALMLRRKRS